MNHRFHGFSRFNRRRPYSADRGLSRPRSCLLGAAISAAAPISASAPSTIAAVATIATLRLAAAVALLARVDFNRDSSGFRLFGGGGGLFSLFLFGQLAPFQNRISDARGEQPHRSQRVVIAGNNV